MDRRLNRRNLLLGAGAVAGATTVGGVAIAAQSAMLDGQPAVDAGEPAAPRFIRGFFVGTGQNPIGAAIVLIVSDGTVSVDVNPMTHTGDAGPIVSSDPAVRAFLLELVERLRAESYQNRAITSELKTKRDPHLRGEWINCPSCLGRDSDDCTTCYGRGCIWRSF